MPVEREVLLKRIEYLRDVQRSLEGAIKEAIAILVASPIANALIRTPSIFLAISTGFTIIVVALFLALIRIQKEVSSRWSEAMKDPRWWEKIPWVGVAGIIAAVTSIIAILLNW